MSIEDIFDDIHNELERQFEKWGEQDHSPREWLAIIAEEFGEVAKDINENNLYGYVKELVQVAACCIRAVENAQTRFWTPRLKTHDPEPEPVIYEKGNLYVITIQACHDLPRVFVPEKRYVAEAIGGYYKPVFKVLRREHAHEAVEKRFVGANILGMSCIASFEPYIEQVD